MFEKKEDKEKDRALAQKTQALFLRIKPIIAGQLEVDENKVAFDSKIAEDLAADSLESIEIVMALEEEFNIEILDVEADKMKTIGDIAAYLAVKGIE